MIYSAKTALLALGLLCVPGLSGCGGSSETSTPAPITSQPRSSSAALSSGLTATLTESVDTLVPGKTITFTVSLTNPTVQPISVRLPPGCSGVDPNLPDTTVSIVDTSGTLVYPTGPAPLFPCRTDLLPVTQTLAPGQTLQSTLSLGSATGAPQVFRTQGTYTVHAAVVTSLSGADTLGPLPLTVQ